MQQHLLVTVHKYFHKSLGKNSNIENGRDPTHESFSPEITVQEALPMRGRKEGRRVKAVLRPDTEEPLPRQSSPWPECEAEGNCQMN